MKKILSIVACFVLAFAVSLTFVGCGGKGWEPNYRIKFVELDKYWVEYGGKVYAKDGNLVFAQGGHYGYDVLIKEDLQNEQFVLDVYGGQNWISAKYYGDAWHIAGSGSEDVQDGYNENRENHSSVYGFVNYHNGPGYLSYGYTDVNNITEDERITVIQLDNVTLTIGTNDVECLVFDYVYDDGDTFGHHRYFFAADSHICLKELYTSDRNADIVTSGSVELEATLYKVGVAMADVLAAKGEGPAPDLSAYV